MSLLKLIKEHLNDDITNTDRGIKLYAQYAAANNTLLKKFKQGKLLNRMMNPKFWMEVVNVLEFNERAENANKSKGKGSVKHFGAAKTPAKKPAPKAKKPAPKDKNTNYPPELLLEINQKGKLQNLIDKLNKELSKVSEEDTPENNSQRKAIAAQIDDEGKKLSAIEQKQEFWEKHGQMLIVNPDAEALENLKKERRNASSQRRKWEVKLEEENKAKVPNEKRLIEIQGKIDAFTDEHYQADIQIKHLEKKAKAK